MFHLPVRRVSMSLRLLSVLCLMALFLPATAAASPIGPGFPPAAATQQWPPPGCQLGTQSSGAESLICMPQVWNGRLLVYAHGYVAAMAPIGIPQDQLYLADGTFIPDLARSQGFAFATTGYRANGLVVPDGLADLEDLVATFKTLHPDTFKVYLVGASEGGLITTLAMEKPAPVFDGGLATCGPIGDFKAHINYLGDFRVVFDYYFPEVLPPSPVSIPADLITNWPTHTQTVLIPTIAAPANAVSVTQLLNVTQAAVDPADPASVLTTTLGILWYNVFGTNDANVKLGGQPFDNWTRTYTGSLNDAALNAEVERFQATGNVTATLQAGYQTTGMLHRPLVTLHNLLDPIVPYWHEGLYQAKVVAQGSTPLHINLTSSSYGHCNFSVLEILAGLGTLERMVEVYRGYMPLVRKEP
jgi:hypothetical protein